MSGTEIATLAQQILEKDLPKTTAQVAVGISKMLNKKVSESEVFDELVKAEAAGAIRRIRSEVFDEYRPVSTTSWVILEASLMTPAPRSENESSAKFSNGYITDAMIVVSEPVFLSTRGFKVKNLGVPVLEVREAMEKIVTEAKHELLIACPYYDELFIDILRTNAEGISKLTKLSIMCEASNPILAKACKLFPNAKVKTLHGSIYAEQGKQFKVQGVHAKIMIADRSQVLVGSFNFRSAMSHIT
jgi:hypothetical protein